MAVIDADGVICTYEACACNTHTHACMHACMHACIHTQGVTHILNCCEPWVASGPNDHEVKYAGFEAYDEEGYVRARARV